MKKPASPPLPAGKQLVMIVDDEPDMLHMLKLVVARECDCEVILASTGRMALKELEHCRPDVVVTDIKMPDLDGLLLLKKITELDKTISVIIMTGYGTIEMAVQALKDGAYDFLQKPFDKDHIVRVIRYCLERTRLLRDNRQLQEKLDDLVLPQGFVGQSPALRKVLDLIARVADTDATVLIRGESGTGKELAARALHELSNRRQQRMITVNCPALPEQILESELFGYCKGAFTGATQDKKGLFLAADQSTILLDEIADIPVAVQTKLLRVLQEKEIQPLGQNNTIKVEARVVASTNQDLEARILAGEFRADLFYRLNVVTVKMPPLRDMREDMPLLVHHFLERYKRQHGRPDLVIAPEALQFLYQQEWPGNVRELQHTIKRAVLLAPGNTVSVSDVCVADEKADRLRCPQDQLQQLCNLSYNEAKAEVVQRFSIAYLGQLLSRHQGNVTAAAKQCGLERQAFQRLMRRHGVLSTDFKHRKKTGRSGQNGG
ncbi:MAG: sigma-54-dependent Fis family transcriptional regulator [Deltaproteobacteria bacterium]|nr:sigma-54-dependent Fis family transcriptional regulator [Deltaproteobacteria bacterium]